ncbi:anti-sigma factor [Streptomyces hypolithicus]
MNSVELHTLTGAYALHALTPEERAEFESHLVDCSPCAQETHELVATAARLGVAVSVPPPTAMKAEVLRRITSERQDPPHVPRSSPHESASRRWGRGVPRFALAACLAAAAAFGGIAVWQHDEAGDAQDQARRTQQQSEALTSVLAAPDAKISVGELTDDATGTVVVSRERNKAAFLAAGMPPAPSGKVYQLWFNDGGTMRSAGLMTGENTGATQAVLMDGPLDKASGMGITVEPAGGSEQPTTDPLALMNFPTA